MHAASLNFSEMGGAGCLLKLARYLDNPHLIRLKQELEEWILIFKN
jgi:hypothetical protein